jgi:hypothetical protein
MTGSRGNREDPRPRDEHPPAMTQKERFLGTLLGTGADRFPLFDLEPAEETLDKWRGEGMPSDRSFAEFFDIEEHVSVGLNLRSNPRFVGSPAELDDAVLFERHYNPDDPARYEEDFVDNCRRSARDGRVVSIDAWGGGLLQMLGTGDWHSLEALMIAFVEKPALIERVLGKVVDHYCACLERTLSRVRVDYAALYEPIASPAGPVISPAMFERYALPGYRRVLALLESHGVALRILCTTGGDLSALFPPLIEAGINGFWISNTRSANTDYPTLRRTFGPDLALIGGVDSGALRHDDEDAVRRAVTETVPGLLESGRYLPCLDDRPRGDVSYGQYALFRRTLSELAGL